MRLQIPASLLVGLGTLLAVGAVQGQGTFQNLDFEAANVAGYPPRSFVPASDALPSWSGYYSSSTNTRAATQVGYDLISLGGVLISVMDSNATSFRPLQGTYSGFLVGGFSSEGPTSASISQTGLVPAGAESLLFDAIVYGTPFIITLGGQAIDMIPFQTFSNYTVYGGNIPAALAGQTATLSFTEPPPTGPYSAYFEFDNIRFSDQSVPEPTAFALSVLGALLLGWRVVRRGR